MRRRDFLIGSAFVLSAGAGEVIKPRRLVSLMPPGEKLSDILPRRVEGWVSQDMSDLVAPETPNSLAARLYGETVGRVYREQASGAELFMLMAHGDVQSSELQLHRPEVCYPAFGFAITQSAPIDLRLSNQVSIPGRRLVAESNADKETVVYWTRFGEFFPTTTAEQRGDRFATVLNGYITDGLLARFSAAGDDIASSLATMNRFIPKLVERVASDKRRALIGTSRAALLAGWHS